MFYSQEHLVRWMVYFIFSNNNSDYLKKARKSGQITG